MVLNPRMKKRLQLIAPYLTMPFWTIFAIKWVSGALFGSHFMVNGFIPFIRYFSQTFQNPYEHFINSAIIPFSYPSGMLFLAGLAMIPAEWLLPEIWMQNLNFQLLLVRMPLLFFDVIIYLSLCLLLPTNGKKVLWFYYASPVLFYISYLHGQLDVIPTALLVLSLIFLIRKHQFISFILLGAGIATKTHLLAALPFYLIYLYRNQISLIKISQFLVVLLGVFLLLNPYIFSDAFLKIVFDNPEQQRIFSLAIPFNFKDLTLFVAPAAILLIIYKFSTYKKLNIDSLLLAIGLTYTVLVALVPPMPGWYYWAFPFLIFFIIKFRNAPLVSFFAVNVFFLLYFVFSREGYLIESLMPIMPELSGSVTPYEILGSKAYVFENILFTFLEVSLVVLLAWSYKMGIQTNDIFQRTKDHFLLAIAGDSGVGKSTLASTIETVVGSNQIVVVNGDDIHKWERGNPNWQNVTHLNPKANHIHTDFEHAVALMRGEPIERLSYDHSTGTFIGPVKIYPNRFIMFQGLMPFLLDNMRNIPDLKIYIETDEPLRVQWKVERDRSLRNYKVQTVRQQIEQRKPDAEKFIHPQKEFADWVIHYIADKETDGLSLEYLFRNSIVLDGLIEELNQETSLVVEHNYLDINFQRVKISGSLAADRVSRIAYNLYPNIFDLVGNQPNFENDLLGIHQLFFINFLNNFYRSKHAALS